MPAAANRMTWAAAATVLTAAFVWLVYGVGADSDLASSYDFRESLYHYKTLWVEAVREGRIPLWNPHTFAGWPLLGDPESQVFYPANLLYLLLPLGQALSADVALHLVAGWLGTARLARRALGLDAGPAFFAGLVFATSGFVVARGYAGHLTFLQATGLLPWLALAVHAVTRAAAEHGLRDWRAVARPAAGGGAVLGLMLLTGALPIAWLACVGVGLLGAGWLVSAPGGWRSLPGALAGGVALALLGAGLAAVQLLPNAELADVSNRPAHDYAYASTVSLEPAALLTAVSPRVALDAESRIPWHEMYAYAGLAPLALALLGLAAGLRDRRVLALLPAGAFMALYMFGDGLPFHRLLFDHVPTFDVFRAPARALVVVFLVLALLAGAGLQRLVAALGARGALAAAVLALACAATLADVVTAARWHRPVLLGRGNLPEVAWRNLATVRANAAPLVADGAWYRYWASPTVLPANYAVTIDRLSVNGYAGLVPERFQRYVGTMTGYGTGALGLNMLNPAIIAGAPRFSLRLLGVKYELVRGQLHERPGGPDVPRGWWVPRERRLPDGEAALAWVAGPAFQPFAEAVVEGPAAGATAAATPGAMPGATSGAVAVAVRDRSPESLLIDVAPQPGGVLVLSEMYYPGWRAEAQGQELPVFRCDYILRCVRLGPAATPTTIRMELEPASLRLGALLSALALAAVAVLLVATRARAAGMRG